MTLLMEQPTKTEALHLRQTAAWRFIHESIRAFKAKTKWKTTLAERAQLETVTVRETFRLDHYRRVCEARKLFNLPMKEVL